MNWENIRWWLNDFFDLSITILGILLMVLLSIFAILGIKYLIIELAAI